MKLMGPLVAVLQWYEWSFQAAMWRTIENYMNGYSSSATFSPSYRCYFLFVSILVYTHIHTEQCNVHKIMRSCELMLEHVTLFVLVNTSQDKNPWMRKWTNTPGQLIQWSKYRRAQSTIASAHPSSLHNSTCIDFHKPTIQTQLRDCGTYSSRETRLEMLTSYRPSPSHC